MCKPDFRDSIGLADLFGLGFECALRDHVLHAFLEYPVTRSGTKRFIALRSALLRFTFRFFA